MLVHGIGVVVLCECDFKIFLFVQFSLTFATHIHARLGLFLMNAVLCVANISVETRVFTFISILSFFPSHKTGTYSQSLHTKSITIQTHSHLLRSPKICTQHFSAGNRGRKKAYHLPKYLTRTEMRTSAE